MDTNSGNPTFGIPEGEVRVENPDGISMTHGNTVDHNLYDTGGQRPALTSGDWDVRPPGLGRRGRP